MRVNLLVFLVVAFVQFASADTSSAKSRSTLIELILSSDQNDIPHTQRSLRDGTEEGEEERIVVNLPIFKSAQEFVKTMASNVGKHVLYCILRVARLSLIDAFTFLRLHHVNTVNATKSIRLKAWIKYAAKVIKNNPGAMKAVAEKYGDNDLVKFALHVLKSQRTENAATELETPLVGVSNGHKMSADAAATESETPLVGVSNGHKMSPEAAFTFYQPLNEAIPLMRVSAMKAWVEYVKDTDTTGFSDVTIMKVLTSVDAKDRLKILEIMREVPKTEQIVSMLESLLLTDWKNQRITTTHLFADLKLNTNVNDLLYNPNLDLYSKYAIIVIPNTTIELALVTAANKAYGPGPLAKMLMMEVRLKRKKHKLATTLLQVLYQQWQMMASTRNDVAAMCWSKGIMDLIDDEAEVVTGYVAFLNKQTQS